MKRIEMFLKKKIEEARINTKIEKIETALQAATINAKEQKLDAELELQQIMENIAENKSDLTDVVKNISNVFDKKEEAELTLKRIEDIKTWLNEDVKPD